MRLSTLIGRKFAFSNVVGSGVQSAPALQALNTSSPNGLEISGRTVGKKSTNSFRSPALRVIRLAKDWKLPFPFCCPYRIDTETESVLRFEMKMSETNRAE